MSSIKIFNEGIETIKNLPAHPKLFWCRKSQKSSHPWGPIDPNLGELWPDRKYTTTFSTRFDYLVKYGKPDLGVFTYIGEETEDFLELLKKGDQVLFRENEGLTSFGINFKELTLHSEIINKLHDNPKYLSLANDFLKKQRMFGCYFEIRYSKEDKMLVSLPILYFDASYLDFFENVIVSNLFSQKIPAGQTREETIKTLVSSLYFDRNLSIKSTRSFEPIFVIYENEDEANFFIEPRSNLKTIWWSNSFDSK